MPADGLITIPSSHGPQETMAKLEAEVKAKGLTVFAHIDHAAGAATVGLSLLPTDLLIFGNAMGGTPPGAGRHRRSASTTTQDVGMAGRVTARPSCRTTTQVRSPSATGLDPMLQATVKALSGALAAITAAATKPH